MAMKCSSEMLSSLPFKQWDGAKSNRVGKCSFVGYESCAKGSVKLSMKSLCLGMRLVAGTSKFVFFVASLNPR